MRLVKGILLLLLMVSVSATASADIQDGILFHSYDVPADLRTSMVVSGAKNSITFSDSLTVAFSLKLNLNKGKFGYICRIDLDDLLPVDLLLSPESNDPRLCITANHENIASLDNIGGKLDEWNDICLKVEEKGDSLVLSVNTKPVFSIRNDSRRHHATAYFGRVDAQGLMTSDVAPMMIANLRVGIDRKKHLSWPLTGPADLVSQHGVTISCSNHSFLRDANRRWTRIWSSVFPDAVQSCISRDKSEVFFICDGRIVENDIFSGQAMTHPFATDMNIRLVTGEFVSTADSSLAYADMETGKFIRYDRQSRDWEAANPKSRKSVHLHHNTVYLDSLAIQMFGYGQHRYSNECFIWDPSSGTVGQREINVHPRYLSGAGIYDGKIYVLGGKGNESGQQGLGAQIYDSLIEIDPSDWTARTLWESPCLSDLVPVHDLVFEDGGRSFLTLIYNPEVSDSRLQLMRFNMEDGSAQALADPVPYRFTDITSDVRFFYSDESDAFYAAICSVDENGQNKGELYMLGSPVLTETDEEYQDSGTPLLVFILLGGMAIAALTLAFRKKSRTMEDDENAEDVECAGDCQPEMPAEAKQPHPGICLLGSFRAIDRTGCDITSSFSPTLIQLFTILVLYTEEKGGVTNAILKALLWPDMPDERFNNNKGVNIRKLRTLLSSIGDMSVVVEGGVWSFRDPECLCDYPSAKADISNGNAEEVILAAMHGPLLPEYNFDWLDPFKASYADLTISRLSVVVPDGSQPELMVRAADARMKFDSLDEDAILQKCKALIALGKVKTAQSVFKHFTEEYSTVMGEEFKTDFTSFVKNIHR